MTDTTTGGWQDNATHTLKVAVLYFDTGTENISAGWTPDGTTESTILLAAKGNTSLWNWSPFILISTAKTAAGYYNNFNYADLRIFSTGDLYLGALAVLDKSFGGIIVFSPQDLVPHPPLYRPAITDLLNLEKVFAAPSNTRDGDVWLHKQGATTIGVPIGGLALALTYPATIADALTLEVNDGGATKKTTLS